MYWGEPKAALGHNSKQPFLWVHLTSDLTAASGGVVFYWEREHHFKSHTVLQSHIPVEAFPTVDHTHNSVLLGQISKDVGDRMSGVLPNTHGTWP